MKVRLTENELISLIGRILKEEKFLLKEGAGTFDNPYSDDDIQPDVDTVVDDLDGYVNESNVNSIFNILTKYKNKVAIDDTNPDQPVKVSALKRFADLYAMDEGGTTLISDLNSIGTSTFSNSATKTLSQVKAILNSGVAQAVQAPVVNSSELKSCASKETGFIQGATDWWRIVPFGNGEIRGFNDGRVSGKGNVFYVPKGKDKETHATTGKCVSGVLDIAAWVKI